MQAIKVLILLVVALTLTATTQAQRWRDHVGREFYLAFGPNTGGEQPEIEADNLMALDMIGLKAATVVVEIPGFGFSQTVNLEPNVVSRVQLPSGNQNSATVALLRTDGERVLKGRSVHITATEDITVYGLSHKKFSEDGFLALPVDALGKEYRVVSYPLSDAGQGSEMPGQFIVVAVEDQTVVTITPRAKTANNRAIGVPFVAILDRGDTYLVQSSLDPNSDLTGSLISADKPIAVFSGHERTETPKGARLYDSSPASRDHLVEQLPPVSACGDSFVVVPFWGSQRPDVLRVIATANETQVTSNGVLVNTLNAGEYYEDASLRVPAFIVTTRPVVVAQYMGTSMGKLGDQNRPSQSDPSMMIVPPIEQFLSEYQFVSLAAPASRDSSFVTLVYPQSAFESIKVDGRELHAQAPIPGGEYVTTTLTLDPGPHTITSGLPVGAYLYAVSRDAASYSMPAGIGLEPGGQTKSHVASKPEGIMTTSIMIVDGDRLLLDVGSEGLLSIFDRAGRLVKRVFVAGGSARSLDTSDLTSGIYFIRGAEGKSRGSFLIP